MSLTVRLFKKSDAEILSKIAFDGFKTFLKDKVTEMVPPEDWIEIAETSNRTQENAIFVAEEGGAVKGFLSATANLKRRLGTLNNIAVDPEWHAKGIGHALFLEAEKFWIERKMRKVCTCVSSINPKAQIYYIKQGFTPEGIRKDHFFDGVDEISMAKFYHY